MLTLSTFDCRRLPCSALVPIGASAAAAGGRRTHQGRVGLGVRRPRERPGTRGARSGCLRSGYAADRPDGRVGITLNDDTRVSLGPGSEVRLDQFVYAPADGRVGLVLNIVRGLVAYVSGRIAKLSPDAVKLGTPNAIVGVRGTTPRAARDGMNRGRYSVVFAGCAAVIFRLQPAPGAHAGTSRRHDGGALLPDPDGGVVGKAVVSNASGAAELDTARASTRVTGNRAPGDVTSLGEAEARGALQGMCCPRCRPRRITSRSISSSSRMH